MKIYSENGYLDMKTIIESKYTFIFICGGRGIGKTYGALQYLRNNGIKFMFMRRTQSQIDLINKPEYSPFKSVDIENNYITVSKPISKYTSGFYNGVLDDSGNVNAVGECIGYTCALSTISNFRGFDASDIRVQVFDEFIPERHERPIKNEASALLNAYETMNRNRELKGKDPLKLLCLANANDMGNPIFLELGLVRIAERLQKTGREVYTDEKRSILLIMPNKSPISKAKGNTAIYKLAQNSDFARMSLNNEFTGENMSAVKSMPLKEFIPIVTIGEITFYRHKSQAFYYVSTHKTGAPAIFGLSETERKRFTRSYYWLFDEYLKDNIIFEEHICEILLTKYFN